MNIFIVIENQCNIHNALCVWSLLFILGFNVNVQNLFIVIFPSNVLRDGPHEAEGVGAQCGAGHEAGARAGHHPAQAAAAAALAGSPAEAGRHVSHV